MTATQPANPPAPALTVPEGFSLHSENSAHILLPNDNGAFLNPIQEFNRDVSIACITAWGELAEEARRKRVEEQAARPKKKRAKKDEAGASVAGAEQVKEGEEQAGPSGTNVPEKKEPSPLKFTILEALSATGLRSIRYAKEIPNAKKIIANDLSPTAADAIRRNVEINGLGEQRTTAEDGTETITPARVVVNEGDACTLMYNHRTGRDRVEVVDLDPYGTASPFIDAAVQCVSDGGLLCVTCTDLSVLATINYPEKCFSNYGGVPLKAEYCHEAALRLVLHSISTSAARYGRYIQPLVSLSIDFYVRVFVRVKSSPFEVKKASINTATYYVCTSCQSFYEQPLGKLKTTVHESSGNVNHIFRTNAGPPVGDRCPECNSALHVAGPMWSGVIHDKEFIGKVLEHVEADETKYGTSARMKGMLTVAKEELDTPFYFSPANLSGVFHCVCPSLNDVASALLNAGHQVSRSHALAGSLKTTATRADVHDIFRSWIKKNPINMKKLGEASPARVLLAKEPRAEADFKHHPKSITKSSSVKLVRYQQNPTPNWGPGTKAGSGKKRKRPQEE